jgi:hypothetical protein
LGWFKGDGCFFAALRAGGFSFGSHLSAATTATRLGALSFAAFATLRLVFEALVGEKHLFAGGKYELGTTLRTLQDLIVEFHHRSPCDPFRAVGNGMSFTMGLDT